MASFLENIAEYLDDQNVGTAATDIFVGVQPASPDDCVTILGGVGLPPNTNIMELEFPRFQVIVRNKDYSLGDAKLREIRALLHVKIGLQLTDFYILRCHAQQDGGPIGEDNKGRYEFSINFYAEIREQAA
jgi:hypothetical protein